MFISHSIAEMSNGDLNLSEIQRDVAILLYEILASVVIVK